MIKAVVYVCKKHIKNSFPNKSDIYVCGMEKPIQAWLAINEIRAGQLLVIVYSGENKCIYLLSEDHRMLQISGVKDEFREADTVLNPSLAWITLKRMTRVVLEQSFKILSVSEMVENKNILKEYEIKAFEYVLTKECDSFTTCKKLVAEIALNVLGDKLGRTMALACATAKKPSKAELRRQPLIMSEKD